MAGLTHPTLGELKQDEEKWLKFFSKKTLIVCILGALPGYLFFLLVITFFKSKLAGGIVWAVWELFLFLIMSIKLDVESHRLTGGGQYVYEVMLRKICKRLSRKTYIKYNETENDEKRGD